jgi:hypothetical protein
MSNIGKTAINEQDVGRQLHLIGIIKGKVRVHALPGCRVNPVINR